VSDAGLLDLTLLADAFGSGVAPGPLLPTNVVASALGRASTADIHNELLAGVMSGEVVATWAWAEPLPSVAAFGIEMRAERDGARHVLTGVKEPVEAAADADVLLVTATTTQGLTQFLVPASAPGVTITRLESLDLVRRFARVEFDHVAVPEASIVGKVDQAASDVEWQLQIAIVIQSAESVGAAQAAFDLTLEWMFNRYSFGRPLAAYQALKHRCADMKVWLEASHALADAAAREVSGALRTAPETVSVTQAYLGEQLPELLQQCVQLHGGIGVTYEHDLHLYLRRITTNRVSFGTPADHRRRIAQLRTAAA
jgi:alkylation response protein AidB-like acyl-CoA dehydrogenase